MTPQSIITNCLEQALKLKCNSLVFMVNGPKTTIFVKTLERQLPLFQIPTDIFFATCNHLFQTNEFDETKRMKFSPDATLRMVRVQTNLVRKATQGMDVLLTTALTGRTRYQLLWYIDLPRKTEKEFEDCSNTMKFEQSSTDDSDQSNPAVIEHENRVRAAEQAQQDYEQYLCFIRMFDSWAYEDSSEYSTLSRNEGFFPAYTTVELYVDIQHLN
ncbi:hypothetical protein ACNO5E_18445 [Vibrio parahaemolyticus]|uniref:hypothetical protein n=1 Tax=Vibrio parahaemolyticus TaxID=670 RepID=UPI0008133023|nr:hypothetical protein [Vibrio parahaemolyticus]OCP68429.1 hypothetical protein AKH08_16600 [Vibrio parahaemolyticus]